MKITSLIALFFFLIACSENSEFNQDSNVNPRTTFPTVCNGMLCFNDMHDLQDYYDYLDNLISGDDSDTTSGVGDIDSVLSIVESNYAYTSLRSVLDIDNLSDADFERLANKDWVGDVARMSILNSNYEFNVGGNVYVKYSKNQYYIIPEDSTNAINAFRNADKGGLYDTIPYGLVHQYIDLDSPTKGMDFSDPDTIIPSPPIGYRSPILEITVERDPCNGRRAYITLRLPDRDVIPTEYYYARFSITDFGDGSPLPSSIWTNKAPFAHTYSTAATFTIKGHAEYTYDDNNHVAHTVKYDQSYTFSTVGENCSFNETHTDSFPDDGNNLRIEIKNWNVTDVMGSHVGARTTSFHKNNGNWYKHKVDIIYAKIDGQWHAYDYDLAGCAFQGYIHETEYKTHARDARVSERICNQCDPGLHVGFHLGPVNSQCPVYQEDDLNSYHYGQTSSSSLSRKLTIKSCN